MMSEDQTSLLRSYLSDFMKEVHANARFHGWWDDSRSGAECIALMHSELSEALEAQRKTEVITVNDEDFDPYVSVSRPADKHLPHLPNEAVELADCIIRILDYAGQTGLPVVEAMIEKHEFNKSRPYKHGKKF